MAGYTSGVGIIDIAPGLWIWRARHPFWQEGDDWPEIVTSTFVSAGKERYVIDALVPTLDNIGLWERLDSAPPTSILVTMPDHVRDVDLFSRRYKARPMGPLLFFPEDVPKIKLDPILPGMELAGGLVPLYDGRGRMETPIWIPEHRTIVFGDALTERKGKLLVWYSYAHNERELPALRAMLRLPFERVIISHCDNHPVLGRSDFEKALELPPYKF